MRGVAVVGSTTNQTKFPFATWPSHNYLLIVYIMLMATAAIAAAAAAAASHLLLHLCVHLIFFSFCFILLQLNYCSPKAINFGSCEPNSETTTNENREKKKCEMERSPELNSHSQCNGFQLPRHSPWYGVCVCVLCLGVFFSSFFCLLDVTWAEQIALAALVVIYAKLFIHVNACVCSALQHSIGIL